MNYLLGWASEVIDTRILDKAAERRLPTPPDKPVLEQVAPVWLRFLRLKGLGEHGLRGMMERSRSDQIRDLASELLKVEPIEVNDILGWS